MGSGALERQGPRATRCALAYQRLDRKMAIIDRHTARFTSSVGAVIESGHGEFHLVEQFVHRVHRRTVGLLFSHASVAHCVRFRRNVDSGPDHDVDGRYRHVVLDQGCHRCHTSRASVHVLVVPSGGPLGLHALERTPAVWGIS